MEERFSLGVGVGTKNGGEGLGRGRSEMAGKGEVCRDVRGGDRVVVQQSGGGGNGVGMTA